MAKKINRKLVARHDGMPVFFIVYKPQVEGKNVYSNFIHPDLKEDNELEELLKKVGERVRFYYEQHPEQLEEILQIMRT